MYVIAGLKGLLLFWGFKGNINTSKGENLHIWTYCYLLSGPEDIHVLLLKFTPSSEGLTFEKKDIETVSLLLGSVSIWLI